MKGGGHISKNDRKEWARSHYKGVENAIKMSFSPDFKTLDEEGIRLDVRNSIKHGFFATYCSGHASTMAEKKRFLEIICDEADGRLCVGTTGFLPSLDENFELLAHAEKLGCSHALVGYPRGRNPKSEDEVYEYFRTIIDSTNLGIILYGFRDPDLTRFHPTGMAIETFDRLADLPNVIGMKLTQPINPATAFQLCERLGDRLLMGPANLDQIPLLAKSYNIQWTGQWIVEGVQTPEKPYIVDFMGLVNSGRLTDAMKIYSQMEPAYRLVHEVQGPLLVKGGHPWAHMKYFQWCAGGNGGLPRETGMRPDQVSVLDAKERKTIRDTYKRIGITVPDDPDESFAVGRVNYSNGARISDMPATPLYES